MKTKKYVIAMAIFGGMLFTTYAANVMHLDGQQITKVEKGCIKVIPTR